MKAYQFAIAILGVAVGVVLLTPSGLGQAEKIKGKAKDLKRQIEATNHPAPVKTNLPPKRPR